MSVIYKTVPEKNKVIALLKSKDGTTYRGIATCSSMDTFSEETGRQIAQLKLKKSFLAKKLKSILKINASCERYIKYTEDKLAKSRASQKRVEEELAGIQESLSTYTTPSK